MSKPKISPIGSRLDASTVLEMAKEKDPIAVVTIGLDDDNGMFLMCGGEALDYGLLYWLLVEAQSQVHNISASSGVELH